MQLREIPMLMEAGRGQVFTDALDINAVFIALQIGPAYENKITPHHDVVLQLFIVQEN